MSGRPLNKRTSKADVVNTGTPSNDLSNALLLKRFDDMQQSLKILNEDVRKIQDTLLEVNTTKRVLSIVIGVAASLGAGLISAIVWTVTKVIENGGIKF